MKIDKSILFVQSGDFEEAYKRFATGGPETYRDQKASVDFVASLAPAAKVMTFAFVERNYKTQLETNLWAQGGSRGSFGAQEAAQLLDQTKATHLVLRTPNVEILREAAKRRIYVLPCFADIFSRKGLRTRYRNWKLRSALIRCQTPCYSNHSLNASRSMVEALGLSSEKVVPWDWSKVPVIPEPKSAVANAQRPTAFFAGMLSEDKGVGDCLKAVAILREQGIIMSISFAGPGDVSLWQARAESLGIGDQVDFLGLISNADVRVEMHRHDFVIVPSRHSYAEGLPNTIYEGLASRSPLIISDHPAFAGRLEDNEECLVFQAANPSALAKCLKRAVQNTELYHNLSKTSANAHDKLYVGIEWSELVTNFINDPLDKTGWTSLHSMASTAYGRN